MKTQTTPNSPKTIKRETFINRLLTVKKVIFLTIQYKSEIDLKPEFRETHIFETQFANIALGASHIRRKNKIEKELGFEVMSDSGSLAWGSLSSNRKLRLHKGKAYLHCFRLRKVRTSEGFFTDQHGNRLDPQKVAEMRKPRSESEVNKRVGWRAYTLDKVEKFWFKGEWILTD